MPVQFPAAIELSSMDGRNGFQLNGITAGDYSGVSVSAAGDINNDAVADLIIGAYYASPNGYKSGQSSVVFGGSSVGSGGTLELSSLNGSNGFTLNGIAATDLSGCSVSAAGDINADGVADLIIGALSADPNGYASGQSYVVFGSSSVGSSGIIELSTLNGSNGFTLNGIAGGDYSGYSASAAGDINADGVADLIIGAINASPNGSQSGQSYVVFGGSGIGSSGTLELSSLNGSNGFQLNGIGADEFSGISVSAAGDINADAVADLIIGAYKANPHGTWSGESYVVFGGSGIGSNGTIELSNLSGSNGFTLNGIAAGDRSGISVSAAGDINADGVADLIIGAYNASPNGFKSGQSSVVFGGSSVGSGGTLELSSLNGGNGFTLNGIAAGDYSGISVSAAGDINADGVADLIIGAYTAAPNGAGSGQSYIVFGGSGIGSGGTLELSSLNGWNGFTLNGIAAGDQSGYSVSAAGDINADGVADLIIGAYKASLHGQYSGQSTVVFGDSLQLLRNQLSLTQSEKVIFTDNNLKATSINHNDAVLQFQISAIQQGQFEFISNPGIPITAFYQQNITDGQVQFVHNGSINPPVYQVNAFTGMWVNTGSQPATIHFAPLFLLNNVMNIDQGGIRVLSVANLNATDSTVPDNTLLFTVSNLEHGYFEAVNAPAHPITRFTQQKIRDQAIQFVQDGSPNVPGYEVIVSDGVYNLPSAAASITLNYLPVLETNNLSIGKGQQVIITSNNLKASDNETPANELVFSISVLKNGHFEFTSYPSEPITQFNQDQINAGTVQFVHNGDPDAPSYNVTVSDASLCTTPNAAVINWDPLIGRINSKTNNTARNTLIGTFLSVGVVGSLLLCYMSMGFLKNQRLKSVAKRGNEEQARFYQDVIIPIAKEIFKQIKVTGFMNYISANQMEAYVAEIATVVNEINQLGINIELQEMNPDHQAQLLNQIVKQMKRHLGVQSGMCNRAWFTGFFKPQVKPEMIGRKAKLIANSVHAALMGNPDDEFEEIELPHVRLLAGDDRRGSMNDNEDGIIESQVTEIARLQKLLNDQEQQQRIELESLQALLNQKAADGSFNSTTSYVKLA